MTTTTIAKETVFTYESDYVFGNECLQAIDDVLMGSLERDPNPSQYLYYGSRSQVVKALNCVKFLGIKLQDTDRMDTDSPIAIYGQKYYTKSMRFMFLVVITVSKASHGDYSVEMEVMNYSNTFFDDRFFGTESIDWKNGSYPKR